MNNGRKCGSMNQAEKQNADTMKGELTMAEQRANELYPNDRAFCGGVASIARDAFIRGWEEALASMRVTITQEDLILGERLNRHEHLY